MNATQTLATNDNQLAELKSRLKATWMTGDYDLFSRYMEKDAEVFFRHLVIPPKTRLLDVGCGAGQVALIAARAGVHVTGCDIATNWLEKARARAAAEGLNIAFEELVAAELTRVCRPGGMIAMANWTPSGFIGQMFKTIGRHIAPSGMPSPVLWGDQATVQERFRDGIADVTFTHRTYHFEYPFGPDGVVEFFRLNYGPMSRAFSSLNPQEQNNLYGELESLWSAHNQAADHTTKVAAEYLEVIATRN